MLHKKMIIAMGLLALIGTAAGSVLAQAKVIVRERITVTVDRNVVQTDVPPILVQGRTLVPARAVFDAFKAQVDWLPGVRRVHILGTQDIWLRIGVARAQVNDRMVPLEVPAMIYRSRTMVPIRFIAETLGATVSWDPDTQVITILTQGTAQTQPQPTALSAPEVVPAPPTTVTPQPDTSAPSY